MKPLRDSECPSKFRFAGFSYQVVTAHNGCLQMEVTIHGKMAHAAIPDTGIDALQGTTAILNALYQQNQLYKTITSQVEADVRRVITEAAASMPGITVDIKRLLMADSWKPDQRNTALVQALQKHGQEVFGEAIPTSGTPLYTDVCLFAAAGIPAAIYGAGPRSVFESHAKRADERLQLEDLRRATKVVARTLFELLTDKA